MSPISEPEDDWHDRPRKLADHAADDHFGDDFSSTWFFASSSREKDLVGQLWATEREAVESARRTPIIPRLVGGSVMVLAVVAMVFMSGDRTARRHVEPLPTSAAITMIFVPPGSPLWSSTFAQRRRLMAVRVAVAVVASNAPREVSGLMEAHLPSAGGAIGTAARQPILRTQPNEVPRKMANPPSSLVMASPPTGSATVAPSTPVYVHHMPPQVRDAPTAAVARLVAAGKPLLPPLISAETERQPDAASPANVASENVLDSLPSGNSIHLEIFYAARNAGTARSVAALLRSKVVGIDSLNIRAGDAKTSVIAYFFPSDRAGATAIAASLRQIANQFVPVELLRRTPQPRPGTVEIFVPDHSAKDLSSAG